MAIHPYIAIEGAIGVGKTTLTRILGSALPAEALLEVFEENPFLGDFYADRARYAFQTQLFFLLSRYRQQHQVIPPTIRHSPLVSDYMFAKDWLFAHLNLAGDELAMYERVHAALDEQIPVPSLIVYLRASTDTLMQRIAYRDRPYERQMSREYLDALRLAYERFFADYSAAPVIVVDTDSLDIVQDGESRRAVVAQVKEALLGAAYQPPLIGVDAETEPLVPAYAGRRIRDLQRAAQRLEQKNLLPSDLYIDYIHLVEAVGRVARSLGTVWAQQAQLLPQVGNRQEAGERALLQHAEEIQHSLAEAMIYILKAANYAQVDLEAALLRRVNGEAAGRP